MKMKWNEYEYQLAQIIPNYKYGHWDMDQAREDNERLSRIVSSYYHEHFKRILANKRRIERELTRLEIYYAP